MKKSLIVAMLSVLLSVNVLTPITYALEDIWEWNGILENGGGVSEDENNEPSWIEGEESSGWENQNTQDFSVTPQNGEQNPQNNEWDAPAKEPTDDTTSTLGDDQSVDNHDVDQSDNTDGDNTGDDNSDNQDVELVIEPETPVDPEVQVMPKLMAPLMNTAPSPVQDVTLVDGQTFNSILETLAGDLSNITAIKEWTTAPDNAKDISADINSGIVAWYDNGTIYYAGGKWVLNPDSHAMFSWLNNVTTIEWIESWNVSNVETMEDMFHGCESIESLDLSSWNTASLTNMKALFTECKSLKKVNLSGWNTSKVTTMSHMFHQNFALTTIIWLEGFDTSKVDTMRHMFSQAPKLVELDLSSFDTTNVVDMSYMFFLQAWYVPSLERIYVSENFVIGDDSSWRHNEMFKRQTKLKWWNGTMCTGTCDSQWEQEHGALFAKIDKPWQKWYFTLKNKIFVIFHASSLFGWDDVVESVIIWETIDENTPSAQPNYQFVWWYDNPELTWEPFDFSQWIIATATIDLYQKRESTLTEPATFLQWSSFGNKLGIMAWNKANIKKIVRSDYIPMWVNKETISLDDTVPVFAWYENGTIYYYSEVEKIYLNANSSQMFQNFTNLISIDMSGWDTSRVEKMQWLFENCNSLTELDLSWWDTSKVTTIQSLFNGCTNIKMIKWIENFNTEEVSNMYWVFFNCKSIIELDLSWWDTSKVTRMRQMFQDAQKLTTIYVSNKFTVNTLTDSGSSENMFNRTYSLMGWDWTSRDSAKKDKTYARIDNLPWQPWYFTDRSLYAKVTFMDESVEILSQLWKIGQVLTAPTLDTKVNQEAVWYKDPQLSEKWDFATEALQDDMTLYAQWECIYWTEKNSDGICVLTKAQEQKNAQIVKDLDVYFIGSSSNVVHETIMDRNMWATSNDITSTGSYWNYYQRWNNYGFSYEEIAAKTVETTYTPVSYNVWSQFPASTYATWVFVKSGTNWQWWDNSQRKNSNMWWGKDDTESLDWAGTKKDRQWPCPDWFYVPSVKDWVSILDAWKDSTLNFGDYTQYSKDLLMPLAWDVHSSATYLQNEWQGLYWASSPVFNNNWYRLKISIDQFKGDSNQPRSTAESVRCFKNVDNTQITVYPNWWVKAMVSILDNKKIHHLWTPTHPDWKDFKWWYTTPNFLHGTNVNTWDDITWKTWLYARWEWDPESFTVTFFDEDGTTELERQEVAEWVTPVYSGTPTKTGNAQYYYTFASWDPLIVAVVSDASYTAKFNTGINQYTITFVDDDGTVLLTWKYEYGTSGANIIKPADPTKADDKNFKYTFAWWSPEIVDVTWDATYTATYDSKKKWWSRSGGWKGWNSDSNTHGSADDERPDEDISQPEDNEEDDVHAWAYKNGLTRYANIKDARFDDPLNRAEMAKISSIFDTNFLGRTPDESKESECSNYPDIQNMTGDLYHFVVQSCELWNMWYHYDNEKYIPKFMPYEPVSIAQASVILSRLAWGKKYIIGPEMWYQWHMYAVYDNALLDNISNPLFYITRREAFTAFYRLDKMLKEKK